MKYEEYCVRVFESDYTEWLQNGLYSRLDGPAVIQADGSKFWYKEGILHREDGPAREYISGKKEYWIDGKYYTEKEFLAKTSPPISCAGKILEFEGKKYRLEEV